jgi:hypothetical protein
MGLRENYVLIRFQTPLFRQIKTISFLLMELHQEQGKFSQQISRLEIPQLLHFHKPLLYLYQLHLRQLAHPHHSLKFQLWLFHLCQPRSPPQRRFLYRLRLVQLLYQLHTLSNQLEFLFKLIQLQP